MLKFKNIIKLQNSKKERIKKKMIIVEGNKEINMALNSKLKLINLIICKKKFKNKKYNFIKKKIFINYKNYKKIAYRKKTEGILGIFYYPKIDYKNKIKLLINNKIKNKKKIIIILDNIEKPGNIGAIIRTVESISIIIDSIIICENKDIYNPNIIRASLGCVFIYPIIIISFNKIIKYLYKDYYFLGTSIMKNNNLSLYKINFYNFKKNIAIIFGNENLGISKKWNKFIFKNINIPIYGKINSLNVSVSVAIILFEIVRQRLKLIN